MYNRATFWRNRLRHHGVTDEILQQKLAAGMRWCSGHKNFVPASDFRAIQCFAFCKTCERDRALFRKFNIGPDWYDLKFAEQGGVCAICGEPPSPTKRLDVDHNHETEQVRGLLCKRCNTALERIEKVLHWVDKALAYLRRYAVLNG